MLCDTCPIMHLYLVCRCPQCRPVTPDQFEGSALELADYSSEVTDSNAYTTAGI